MKKITVAIVALFAIVAFTSASYAANAVQVTLTSPTITKLGCEKAGAVTFGFEAGSTINVGDYWYMDLPTGVTFCKPIDYIIIGDRAVGGTDLLAAMTAGTTTVLTNNTSVSYASFINGISIGNINAVNGAENSGPVTGICESGVPGMAARSTGNIALRVKAASDQRRIYVYAVGGADGAFSGGKGGTLSVQTGHRMNVKILDGKEWNVGNGTADSNTYIITNKSVLTTDADKVTYGQKGATTAAYEMIDPDFATPATNDEEPAVENTLCIKEASTFVGDLIMVSFASKSDKHTFTGDSQIAHSGASLSISLKTCAKNLTEGDIVIGTQNQCKFTYESAVGYCTGSGKFAGNKILVQTTSEFGDPGDKYDVIVTSTTAGTYFNGAGSVKKILTANDECASTPTAVAAGTLGMYVNGTAFTGTPGTSCSVTALSRVNAIKTTLGAVTDLNGYDTLMITLPDMTYDTTIMGAGTKATLSIAIEKYPCGEMYSTTLTLGTYIVATACSNAGTSSSTTLRFPYLTPLDGSLSPWWCGFLITNHSSAAGTAVLTLQDVNGNKATFTTPSIAAGKQFNSADMTITQLIQSTTDAGGDVGSAAYSITAECGFGDARGLVFMGNGAESTGYIVNN